MIAGDIGTLTTSGIHPVLAEALMLAVAACPQEKSLDVSIYAVTIFL